MLVKFTYVCNMIVDCFFRYGEWFGGLYLGLLMFGCY